ncbi:N-formylglutamate deformylase [Pseudaestuariivita rosea]|uniref:N-formylglutamate deformylase n=1 Tax=Pseudaestuariivita rosea TaxID=2763263 RepID=UPI001ABBD158|nr:N-formylglutamate deformylase [Pseudaestuariivita rosea]
MHPAEVSRGSGPIVLGVPHAGTFVPDDIAGQLNDTGRALADTDWHIDRLYDGLLPDITMVRATFHRYVIDANRDPGGQSLYPGQNTTGLVPQTDFDGRPIWHAPPDATEVDRRRTAFHAPYHAALKSELERVRQMHGIAILYDCHSIRSNIPFLFDGTLPDFNIGTNQGRTCAPEIEATVFEFCQATSDYTTTVNGRFKGGWTTRHYGCPAAGIHAIQMELAQSTYLKSEAAPWPYDAAKAERLRGVLARILSRLGDLSPDLKGKT